MRIRLVLLLIPWLALAGLFAPARPALPESTFTVNSTSDFIDKTVGDGVCETNTGNGVCTLRAAVQEASVNPDADTIILPAGTFLLTIAGSGDSPANEDLDLSGSVTLLGAGAENTIIDGNGAVMGDRTLEIVSGTVTIQGVTIRNGRATFGHGGGVLIGSQARVTLANVKVTNNQTTTSNGAGIYVDGRLTLLNSTVSNNASTGGNGGGIFSTTASITVTNSLISQNSAANGGGIYAFSTAYRLTNSTLSGNTATGDGGGIFLDGSDMTIASSALLQNSAVNGGGVFSTSTGTRLVNSTVSGNSATNHGGGLFVQYGVTSLYNTTVTDNYADSDGAGGGRGGGAVAENISSELRFLNSIIAANYETMPFGGGGTIAVEGDCYGNLVSLGNNIVYDHDNGGCTISGPFTQAYPLLGPLANNGGPTQTHALLPGSPAIDAGDIVSCNDNSGAPISTDQRGLPRPAFGGASLRCDLGAFERQFMLLLPLLLR